MRLLTDFEMGAVAGGSMHGQDDPYSWDKDADNDTGNGDSAKKVDECASRATATARDACRERLSQESACVNGVASSTVTVTNPTTEAQGALGLNILKKKPEVSGGGSRSGGGYTVEVVCNPPPAG